MKPIIKTCISVDRPGRIWPVAALFLSLAATSVFAQTEPNKPQLPTTPLPGSTPANKPQQQPTQVIIQQAEPEPKKNGKTQNADPDSEGGYRQQPKADKVPLKDRLMVTGNFGLQLGDWTLINISPMVGYKFSDRFVAGPGFIYQYQDIRGFDTFHMYGGKAFARAAIIDNVFAHTEFEMLNMPKFDYKNGDLYETRTTINSLFVGGGYRFMIGDVASLDAVLLFNLLDSPYSPYTNPVFRIGFTGGW